MESFFKDPYEMIMLHFDELLRGLVSQKLEPVDMSFSKNVSLIKLYNLFYTPKYYSNIITWSMAHDQNLILNFNSLI